MVVSYNSTLLPSTLAGVYVAKVPAPPTAGSGTTPAPPVPSIPQQVAGLVPVFPCCLPSNSIGSFSFTAPDCGGASPNSIFSLNIGGTGFGNFTVTTAATAAQAQTAINNILSAPYSVTVTLTNGIYSATINGSTTSAAVVLTHISGCGAVMSENNINKGGVDCINCDCRQGYPADTIPNDQNFTLPVFGSLTCGDSYHNDSNSFIFQYPTGYNPISSGDFKLQELINNVWTTIATLNNSTNGTTIYTGGTCTNNYGGYTINWGLVLANYGEGTFRFYLSGISANKSAYCFFSPPFCLKNFDCTLTDGTVKFETVDVGGNIGSVTTQGLSWSACCTNKTTGAITPLTINDGIRYFGEFGYETATLQRDFIKYAPGVINKVRDEAIKNFTLKTSQLPLWLHQRFYAYALMADQLYVSDYNQNNSNYNLKHFYIVADSDYAPKYVGSSRYMKVMDVKFKEGQQYVFRDRCCS
jgi:hypothetical protein